MKSLTCLLCVLSLCPLLYAGSVAVSNDEWLFSDDAINMGQDAQFAHNMANWLTGGSGNILILSDNFGLTGTGLHNLLTGDGYSVTVTSTQPKDLSPYTSVWVGGMPIDNLPALTSYVSNGGNVFLEAGTNFPGYAAGEAAYWAPFLNVFGLGLAGVYNNLGPGVFDVSAFKNQPPYGPALFKSVDGLFIYTGNDAVDLHTNNGVQVFYDANGNGLYAAVRTAVPEPASILLAFSGLTIFGFRFSFRR
jgi:hypothetical protein